ncbi:MAG: LLM class flavin-dependent oxidoreductase [Arenibacterium sp.]
MTRYSLLDLSPIPAGSSAAEALAHSLDLSQHAERWGFTRHWLAEHHNMPGIASAATAVVIGHIASGTSTIRVGAGGIMLPNHAPLVIAEQFGTLATLFPDRIDLGLGRAPGTDQTTAWALRRTLAGADDFPRDVIELMGFLGDAVPGQPVQAIPGTGTHVPLFMLGSSLYGAKLAAELGLPYAFASHFAPAALDQAVALYRASFKPSARLEEPYFILAVNAFAADSAEEARRIKSSMQLGFARLRTGQPGPLPEPVDAIEQHVEPTIMRMVDQALRVRVEGDGAQVRDQLSELIDTYAPDEIIFNAQIHNHRARLRSLELVAGAMQSLGETQAASA